MMMFLITTCTLLLWGLMRFVLKSATRQGMSLPPGPKTIPIVGNLFDMSTGKRWETFSSWADKWGKIISVSAFGTNLILLNSLDAATDLLDRRSRIYSSRPNTPMAGVLVGWKDIASFLPYGDRFRHCRKLMHTLVGTSGSLKKLHHIHEQETHTFLKNLLVRPDDLESLIMHTSGALLLRIVYGYRDGESHHNFAEITDQAVNDLYLAIQGKYLVDTFHFLRYLPAWFPGAGFKRRAKNWSLTFENMVQCPFIWIKEQLADGTAESSFVVDLLRESVEDELTIKWAAASMSAAGPDTTAWTVYAFFKAMALYPDVQSRAQAEIDAVVGTSRLPRLSDRQKLPYIEAMVLECLRWHPVAPLGFPHLLTEDDTYQGYFLPKGSLVQANVWKITRDPLVYPNPEMFDPSRFLVSQMKPPQMNPEFTFGWGRRICPGRLMAHEILFIVYARTLAVFNISKYVENGIIIEPSLDRSDGVVSRPSPFKCTIKARNQKAATLISEGIN